MSDERYPRAVERGLALDKPDGLLAFVDSELRGVMSTEPSAGFAERVSIAVRAGQVEAGSRGWWPLAAAAVIALVSGAVVLGPTSRREAGTPSAPPPVVAEKPRHPPTAPAIAPPADRPVVRSATRAARLPMPETYAAASSPPEPEVLVDPRQRVALARFLVLARASQESGGNGPRISAAVLEELLVPMVIVEPLEVPALPTGGGVPR